MIYGSEFNRLLIIRLIKEEGKCRRPQTIVALPIRTFPIQHRNFSLHIAFALVGLHEGCRYRYLACDMQLVQDSTCDLEG